MTMRFAGLAIPFLLLTACNAVPDGEAAPADAAVALGPISQEGCSAYRPADLTDRGYQESDFPRLREIADGVYTYEGLMSNVYWRFTVNNLVVVTDEGVLLADAQGSPEGTKQLVDEIAKITDQPIRYLVVGTDHTTQMGGNSMLPQDITVFAHPTSAGVMRARAHAGTDPDARLLPTDLVTGEHVLNLGGKEIHILHLGRARSGGDLFVYLPQEKILYTTQVFLPGIFPALPGSYPSGWMEVIDKIQAMDVDFYVPGHGFIDNPECFDEQLELQERAFNAVIAEATRLHAAGVPVDKAAEQARFGELDTWTMRSAQAPGSVRRVYQELNGEIPPGPDPVAEMVHAAITGRNP